MGKAEREQMQNSARALEQPSRLGQYIVGALHDIHRRVIEEGWFGKTVHDVVEHYQYNPRDPNANQTMRVDQEAGKASQQDYSPNAFYGRDQAKEQQQDTAMQQEDDLGMER